MAARREGRKEGRQLSEVGKQYQWMIVEDADEDMQVTAACVCVLVLTCMAPRFSVSCSGLDVPRRTELTPSFLRHQAGDKQK